jgi:hypothetical protein
MGLHVETRLAQVLPGGDGRRGSPNRGRLREPRAPDTHGGHRSLSRAAAPSASRTDDRRDETRIDGRRPLASRCRRKPLPRARHTRRRPNAVLRPSFFAHVRSRPGCCASRGRDRHRPCPYPRGPARTARPGSSRTDRERAFRLRRAVRHRGRVCAGCGGRVPCDGHVPQQNDCNRLGAARVREVGDRATEADPTGPHAPRRFAPDPDEVHRRGAGRGRTVASGDGALAAKQAQRRSSRDSSRSPRSACSRRRRKASAPARVGFACHVSRRSAGGERRVLCPALVS